MKALIRSRARFSLDAFAFILVLVGVLSAVVPGQYRLNLWASAILALTGIVLWATVELAQLIRNRDAVERWRFVVLALEVATGVLTFGGAIFVASNEIDKRFSKTPDRLSVYLIIGGALFLALINTVKWLTGRAQERVKWLREINALLYRWPLPLVSEVEPFDDLGVFRSTIAERYAEGTNPPPYIGRDPDVRLDDALNSAALTILVGPSKAGKSRSAYEAIKRLYPDRRIIIPREPKRLAEIFELDPPLQTHSGPAVLWLDDIERYIDAGVLDPKMLADWKVKTPHVVAIGTIRDTEHDRLHTSVGEVARRTRSIFGYSGVREVRLLSQLSNREQDLARQVYIRERFVEGLGAHFAAAQELITQLKNGPSTMPEGFAVVRVAIDWHRLGLPTITKAALSDLFPRYLHMVRPDLEATEERFVQAIQWARKPVSSSASIFSQQGSGEEICFSVFDYVQEYFNTQGAEIDLHANELQEETVDYAIDHISPDDAFRVGVVAGKVGDTNRAERAYRKAITGSRFIAPLAMVDLAMLLDQHRDLTSEAISLFRSAMESGHPVALPMASLALGLVLGRTNDTEEVDELFRRAAESNHPEAAPWAALYLGMRLGTGRNPEKAVQYLLHAFNSGLPGMRAMASGPLAEQFRLLGRMAEAEETYRFVLASGSPDMRPSAEWRLGEILVARGEHKEAVDFLRSAIDSGDPRLTPRATLTLALSYAMQEDDGEAARLLRTIGDSAPPDILIQAELGLGYALAKMNDVEGLAHLRRIFESGPADVSHLAGYFLGGYLAIGGELDAAEEVFQRIVATGDPKWAPQAQAFIESIVSRREAMQADASSRGFSASVRYALARLKHHFSVITSRK